MSRRTIWRYELEDIRSQLVQMPPSSRVLSVQSRDYGDVERIELWAEVTPLDPPRVMLYSAVLVETGEDVPAAGMRYVSTIQLLSGRRVLHAYVTDIQTGEDKF